MTIIQFNSESDISNWKIVNDTVMGGLSNASVYITDNATGIFKGHVSIDNNGGFAMVQYKFDTIHIENFEKFILRIKGDGKTYQFRVKTNQSDKYSYIAIFRSTTNWTNIEIPFYSMYPAYRGKKLDIENYPGKEMGLIAFLIGNKVDENFCLEIHSISLK